MPIYDPYGLIPTSSRQNMNLITGEGINIVWGENPNFTPTEFLSFLPEFNGLVEDDDPSNPGSPSKYNALFNVYAVLASSELAEKRYNEVWTYAMSLYIAHKLQTRFTALANVGSVTDATAKARLLASARPFVASSESVGGVSVSYDTGVTLANSIDGGDWNRTQYGQELMTIVSAYSMGAWLVGL